MGINANRTSILRENSIGEHNTELNTWRREPHEKNQRWTQVLRKG